MFKPLFAVVLASTMAACSGGGSSDGPAPEVNANPAGIWRGTLTDLLQSESDPQGAAHDLFVMADADGYVRIISDNAVGVFFGRGKLDSIEGNEFRGHLDVYSFSPTSTPDKPDPNPKQLRHSKITGELTTQGQWTGDLAFNDLTLYTFEATFDAAESLKGASVEMLAGAGVFAGQSVNEGETITLAFQTGTFTGYDQSCSYRGTVSVPDSTYNLYEFSLLIEDLNSCPSTLRNKTFGGRGALVDEHGVHTLKLLVKNREQILVFNLQQ